MSTTIQTQFNLIAKEYDANRRKFIPCFDTYYKNSTDFLAANIPAPKHILDLGTGTGLSSAHWYNYFPLADFLLVDIADEMLAIAKKRFAGTTNVLYKTADYVEALPKGDFDLIISALSIHHLEAEQKKNVFANIYKKLPAGGIFVNYDQFCAQTPLFSKWYDNYWENKLHTSGLTQHDLARWQERKKLDRECSVEEQVAMLRAAQFEEVNCVFSEQKFAVICAVK